MSHKNRDEIVNLIKWPLITSGLWLRPVTNNLLLSKINYAHSIFARLNFLVFYIGVILELIRLVAENYALTTVIRVLSLVITLAKISITVIIYMKNRVWELLDEVTKKEEKIWEENDDKITTLFLKGIKMGKFFTISLSFLTFFTVLTEHVSGTINNIALIKYNEANNVSVESHFLIPFYFPANKLDHLITTTIISVVFSYAATTYAVATNMIVVILCTHSSAHLAVLQYRLKNYIPEDFTDDQMDKAISTLTNYVFQHRFLIEFNTHINNCCKNIIMMLCVFTSMDVGMVALNVIQMSISDIGWIFYFGMLVVEIYSLAWSVTEVNIQSQAVADAAYESRWYLLNNKGKQLTRMIIQQAQQRPLIMTIGPFGPMTLETFLMIMKAGYSYLSIMLK